MVHEGMTTENERVNEEDEKALRVRRQERTWHKTQNYPQVWMCDVYTNGACFAASKRLTPTYTDVCPHTHLQG